MKKFLFLGLLTLGTTLHAQTNLYVDSAVTVSGAGTSWTSAYKTLNEALAAVNSSIPTAKFVVNVAKGTYYPTGSASGFYRDSTFLIKHDGVKLLGGYPAGGGIRSATSNPVILSGNIGSASDSLDNSFHVMVIAGITSNDTVVVDGFTFSRGNGNNFLGYTYNGMGISRNQGAGLHVSYNQNNIYLVNCRFERNSTSDYGSVGGGVFAHGYVNGSATSAFSLNGCTFDNNTALSGGGAYFINEACTYTVSSCTFLNNRAVLGGGLYSTSTANGTSPCVLNMSSTAFTNNTATVDGGGLLNEANSMTNFNFPVNMQFSGCIFSGNTAAGNGGGMLSRLSASYHSLSCDSCIFSGNSASSGGGVDMDNGNYSNSAGPFASISFTRCSFLNNTTTATGGGFYIPSLFHFLNLKGCRFENNVASSGGGLSLQLALRTTFDSCLIRGNTAVKGGGVYSYFSYSTYGSPTIKRCIISANTASFAGGGVYNGGQLSIGLENTLIAGNYAAYGGAVYDTACNPALVNCTLSGDSALTGRGIYNTGAASPTITNSIIWEGSSSISNNAGSGSSVTYSTVQGGYSGTGNISSNPQFLNPLPAGSAPTANGNYQLNSCSPAIDAGINSAIFISTDLAGRPRLNGTIIDQGAYEYYTPTISGLNTVCAGAVFQLSASLAGGSWSSTNTAIATVNSSGLVTALVPGVDTIIYYIAGACPTTITRRIVVNALPVIAPITGPGNVCMNSTITLTNATLGGQWISANRAVAKINYLGVITPVTTGAVTIRYWVMNLAGCADSVAKTVTVDPLDTSVTQGGGQLTANQSGASYQWIDCAHGNAPVAGQTSQTFTATVNGQYAVVVTLGACSDTSNCFTIAGLSVPGGQMSQPFVQWYPNPASGILTIESSRIPGRIILRDIAGKQLQTMIPTGVVTKLDLSGFPSGVYQLECVWGTDRIVKRINVIR